MRVSCAQLKTTCDALEALTSVGAGNDNEHGWWRRIALALEEGSSTTSGTGTTRASYMQRAAIAAEVAWGGDGDDENLTYNGLLTRIVDAMELDAGTSEGSLGQRLATAAGLVAFA